MLFFFFYSSPPSSVSVSVYLFAIRGTRERRKKNSYCLHSHGEEAQKKPAGL